MKYEDIIEPTYLIRQDIIINAIELVLCEVLDENLVEYFMEHYLDYTALEKFLKENCLDCEESDNYDNI